MDLFSALINEVGSGVIGAIIGAIFGASGLLFFPLKKFMEQKLEKAEQDATDRVRFQKQMFAFASEEQSSISKYLFWMTELMIYFLDNKPCTDGQVDYWKRHLQDCSEDLKTVQAKRKEAEREQLAEIQVDIKK